MDFRDCFPIQWALYFLIIDIQSHRSKIHCRLGSVEAKIFVMSSESDMSLMILNGDITSRMRNNNNIKKLIYVDGTTCKGKEEARSIHPFEFWTFEQLHIRQEVELRCGGFGLGEIRELFSDKQIVMCDTIEDYKVNLDAWSEEMYFDVDENEVGSLEEHIRRLEDQHDCLMKDKLKFEISLVEANN
ncbi:hypothetical protein HanRHA438_Chr09g0376591 [Helianthus annuus]|nr:uncharacterized protein LOC110877011 [Helianthus annuus]XP_021980858.1 uncharacterized protein LOC110877011 [Helianthus annuus]XP_021980859.1 uncharacterized protein LOC110877011 [Helianthus annuus]XP_035833225.1 uncharacterized protein LOC110877011 [Helianthus annuus]XP_035833226.1 uncharacterized protein LOC110877011 [Helianthus annuus]KAF5788943.1 hypothetical protein HanXRQr2_Chr09g0365071 [Helianthus annuus]KAJ0540737.1 hypothetical protein HanHA89_Chr09g0320281 [Helianthus annuus]KA